MMNIADTRDCAFEAFVTNLGKYNEGCLVGEYIKAFFQKHFAKVTL